MADFIPSRVRPLVEVLVLGLLVLPGTSARADAPEKNTAVVPAPKDVKRHEGFLEIAKKGNVDVLFLGDSITDGWRGSGKQVWEKNYAPLKAANFGIGGDRTQHVLWRLRNGELDGINPKVAVLMIGTNNLGGNTDEQIAEGVKTIVEEIHKQKPETKVLLLGIFPRGASAKDPARTKIKEINEMISKLDDGGKHVKYLDIGDKFLDGEGNLSKDIMPDYLHPNAKGYEIWAEATDPTLKQMLKE
jgi:lysophospholipase L1-like esterase